MPVQLSDSARPTTAQLLPLYQAHGWSAATKPEALRLGLLHSDTLITAWDGDRLVGLGNAISDGYLVVYYPHLLVHPDYQGQGIGGQIMARMQEKYGHFHMQMVVADGHAIDFYHKAGFTPAGQTRAMWIYHGNEH